MMSLLDYLQFFQPKYSIPDFNVESLNEIDIDELKKLGIEALFFDVDGTICKFHGTSVDESVREAFNNLKVKFQVYIISNADEERRAKLEIYFGIPAVQTDSKKPGRGPFEEAMNAVKINDPKRCAMIGDRYFTDVFGANKMGMYSIKVKCLDLRSEPILISLARGAENLLVNLYTHLGYSNGKTHKPV
jgi:HAD superfamily phosphatase (TIGR01668 family)